MLIVIFVGQGIYKVSTARFPAGSRHDWVPSSEHKDEVVCMENMEGHLVCDSANSKFFSRSADWEHTPNQEVIPRKGVSFFKAR